MPKGNTYIYRNGDNPNNIASQYGITVQQLLDANPGGTPFTTGQSVMIPQFPTAPQIIQPHALASGGTGLTALDKLKNFAFGNGTVNNPYMNRYKNQPTSQPVSLGPLHGTYGQLPGGQYISQVPPTNRSGSPDYRNNGDVYTPPAASSAAGAYLYGQQGAQTQTNAINAEANSVAYALANTTPPQQISPYAAEALGIDPLQHGYVMKNGVFVLDPNAAAQQQQGNQPQSDNNWQTNPRLRMVLHGKYAHNRQNRYWTTEQQMINRYKRAKHNGGGGGNQQQADQSISGFGLVNFGLASG